MIRVAALWAIIVSAGINIALAIFGPVNSLSWKPIALMAAVGFCIGLSFYDDKYTGIHRIGTSIGFLAGIITSLVIGDFGGDTGFLATIGFGALFALLGYFITNSSIYSS